MKKALVGSSKISLSLGVSIILGYFAFRKVNFDEVFELVLNVKGWYVLLVLFFLLLGQWLRSLRWGLILNPLGSLNQKVLFPITSVGFMFVILLPARLGELVRPYLLQKNSRIHLSTAMATIVLERILDILLLLVFMGVMVSVLDLPNWLVDGSLSVAAVAVGLVGLLVIGGFKWQALERLASLYIPERLFQPLNGILERFYEGMKVLRNRRQTMWVVLITASIWVSFTLSYLFLLKAFDLELGFMAALTVLVLTAVGVSVPTAPGFVGNFHFFCILALSLFGVAREVAVSYALFGHVLMLITISGLGVICLNFSGIQLGVKVFRKKWEGVT